MLRKERFTSPGHAFLHHQEHISNHQQIEAFRRRQQLDLNRYRTETSLDSRNPSLESIEELSFRDNAVQTSDIDHETISLDQGSWRNNEGDRLNDFGVDEEAEFCDDDTVPIAHLLRKRKKVDPNLARLLIGEDQLSEVRL